MVIKYKVYVYDIKLQGSYPVYIAKNDVFDLCEWLNFYTKKFDIAVTNVDIISEYGDRLGSVKFLPSEIDFQTFYTSPEKRLLEHSKQKKAVT